MRRIAVIGAILAALVATTAYGQPRGPVSIIAEIDPGGADTARLEGIVADSRGYLYTSDTTTRRFFRITPTTGLVETLGTLPRSATGMAFDRGGNLYLASGNVVLRVGADQLSAGRISATGVTTYTTNVQGANGLVFDTQGRLYISGGATGTIYRAATDGSSAPWLTGFTGTRQEQMISTNGLAFGPDGRLYSANTSTGAIDRVTINADGTPGPIERFVTSPLLLGADGIAFAANGDLYVCANERNAIVKVTPGGEVTDLFANDNNGPLEFPASPAFIANSLYVSNFDQPRGANNPNAAGRGPGIAGFDAGVAGAPLAIGAVNAPAQPAPTAAPAAPSATPQPTTPSRLPTTADGGAPNLLLGLLYGVLFGLMLIAVGQRVRRG